MTFSERKMNLIGAALFLTLILLLVFRITTCIDLSDESYYAIFQEDWLKGSIASSTLLTIHQTAALIIYPEALLYFILKGSTTGLFLFLRALFLFISILAATTWIIFLKKIGFRALAWAGGLMVLAFIPFGIPSPSYNTLGNQFLTIALATLGCAVFTKQKTQTGWMIISAIAWTLAIIAYPSLIGSLAFLGILVLIYQSPTFPRPSLYLGLLILSTCIGWSIVLWSLSFNKLYQSIIYLSSINDTAGFAKKMDFTLAIFKQNSIFTYLFFSALFIGLTRNYLNFYFRSIAMMMIFATLLFIKSAFFHYSHDAIILAALMGLGLLTGLRLNVSLEKRMIAIIYAISLLTGILICLTATNSFFNFCIGAAPAAFLAILGYPDPATSSKRINTLLSGMFVLPILATSLFLFYGEFPTHTPLKRQYIANGFFAGITASVDDIALLQIVDNHVSPLLAPDNSIAIFARNSGMVLATPARLKMLTSFQLVPDISKKGLAMTHAFYERPENRPHIVLIYRDIYFAPINPMEPNFDEWYALATTLKTPVGELSVYKRR